MPFDTNEQEQFLQELAMQKIRDRRSKSSHKIETDSLVGGILEKDDELLEVKGNTPNKSRFTVTVSRKELDSYIRSTLWHIYRHQYRAERPFLTEATIRSHMSSNARVFLMYILTELENVEAIVRFEVRGKMVYKMHPKRVAKVEERFEHLHDQFANTLAQRLLREKEVSERLEYEKEEEKKRQKEQRKKEKKEKRIVDVSSKVDIGDSPEDIFNTPQDYVKKPPKLRID